MFIEIFPENTQKCVKTIKQNNFYYQICYFVSTDSKFPIEMQVSLGEAELAYPAGKYLISDSSYKINQYGNLELSKYDLKLVPMPLDKKSA